MSKTKKLAAILTTFASITSTRGKDVIVLDRMPYIYYLVQFRMRRKEVIKPFIDPCSKINAISSDYAKQLSIQIWQTNVGVQKIDNLSLETFEIVITGFQFVNKLGRVRFF